MKRHIFKKILSSPVYITKLFIVALITIPGFAAESDLDTSFNGDGKATAGSFHEEGGRDVVIQPDGKIIVVGEKPSGYYTHNMAAVRYNSNGSLDATFGNNGIYVLPPIVGSEFVFAKAVAVDLQSDGKILLAGTGGTTGSINQIFLIIRLNSNGSLDTTFGSGGRAIKDVGSSNTYGHLSSLVFDSTRDKIYVAGTTQISPDGALYGYTVMRFNSDGSPDLTFNGTGTKAFPVADSRALLTNLNDIALQPDGKLVATGSAQYLIPNKPSIESFGTARLNLDGSLDTSFGTNGVVITDFTYTEYNTTYYETAAAQTVSILPNGTIFVGGRGGSGSGGSSRIFYYATQLNTNGGLNSSFGTNGKIIADGVAMLDSVIAPNGKIIIVGALGTDFAVGRLSPNGVLDSTFGTTGFVTTDFGLTESAFAVALQSDGKIVVAGGSKNPLTSGPGSDFSNVARYNGTFVPSTLPQLSISSTDSSAREGTSDMGAFTFTRLGDLSVPLSVSYSILTSPGSAANGIRYSLPVPVGSVSFAIGATTARIQVTPLSDLAVLGTQTVDLAITAGPGYQVSTSSQATVSLLDSPFNEWRIQKFGSLVAAQSPAAAADSSASQDGLSNLMKYALGLHPLFPATPSAISGGTVENVSGQNFLTFSFRRPLPPPADITYFPEISTSLETAGWASAIPFPGFPVDNGDGTETQKYCCANPTNESPFRGFIRLRVTRP